MGAGGDDRRRPGPGRRRRAPWPRAAPPAAGVQKVRFGGDRNETRIVIDLDRAATGKLLADGAARSPRGDRPAQRHDGRRSAGLGPGPGRALGGRRGGASGARLRLDLKANAQVRRRFLLPPRRRRVGLSLCHRPDVHGRARRS